MGAIGALALVLLLLSPAAFAHAVLTDASPADGARVESPPAEARLRFNEPVSLVAVHAFGPGGALALPAPATATDDTLRVPLPVSGAVPGVYTISYRVTSADGHPVAGSLLFGVGVTPDRPGQAEEHHPRSLTTLAALLARALHYGSLLAAAGGGLFVALVAPGLSLARAARLPLVTGVAALATLLNLGLAGVVLTGDSPLALFGMDGWRAALTSTSGVSAAVALTGLALLALGFRGERRPLLLAGALVAAGALAATGHAATAPPRGLAGPLVALHGLAAAFWLGSLAPLLVILRHASGAEAARLVGRFSRYAVVAVAGLVAAGAGLSLLQIGDPSAVTDTDYGRFWLAKMLAVALLLGLATLNRIGLTPALVFDRERTTRRLRLSVGLEMVVMAVVLLATAALGTTPPPRALTPSMTEAATAYTSVALVKDRQAVIGVEPARPGANRLTLHLTQPDGAPFDPRELSVELSLPTAGIEPITRRPERTGAGTFRLDGLTLPVAGRWEIRIDALIDDFEKAIFRVTVPVETSR